MQTFNIECNLILFSESSLQSWKATLSVIKITSIKNLRLHIPHSELKKLLLINFSAVKIINYQSSVARYIAMINASQTRLQLFPQHFILSALGDWPYPSLPVNFLNGLASRAAMRAATVTSVAGGHG